MTWTVREGALSGGDLYVKKACCCQETTGEAHSFLAMDGALCCVQWFCPNTGAEADTFGGLVRSVRLAQGVSQTALASRVGVSQPVMSKWESGRSAPHPDTVTRLAEALGVSFLMSAVRAAS